MTIQKDVAVILGYNEPHKAIDMCYRRYLYIVDKNEVADASNITFNDASSRYGDIDEKDVVNWFNAWCEA